MSSLSTGTCGEGGEEEGGEEGAAATDEEGAKILWEKESGGVDW